MCVRLVLQVQLRMRACLFFIIHRAQYGNGRAQNTNLELCVFFSLLVCPSWIYSMRMHGLAELEPNCTLLQLHNPLLVLLNLKE